MWLVGFRDLQWRRKRFFIAVFATALLFSVSLLLSGISAFFHNETKRTLNALGADSWVVPSGTTGPFTSAKLFPDSAATQVAAVAGVTKADPILLFRETVLIPKPKTLNVIGFTLGGVGQPKLSSGHLPTAPHEIVVDKSFHQGIGHSFDFGKDKYTVVGTTSGVTYLGGTAASFISITDAQSLLVNGAPLATALVLRGVPTGPMPAGYIALDNSQVRTDLARPVSSAASTIGFLNILLWIIAAGIIAAILYMSALERVREFAVIKAMGAANGFVVAGLASQAVVLSLGAAIVAFALALAISPAVPLPVQIPPAAYIELLVVSVSVGIIGSLAGLRKVLAVDPALAFGGA